MGMVHKTCLERWLETENIDSCEICKMAYCTIRTPKSIFEWLRSPDDPKERKRLLKDIITLIVITPVATLGSVWFLDDVIEYIKNVENFVVSTGMTFLVIVLFSGYFLYVMMILGYHYRKYYIWRDSHWNIRLDTHSQTLNILEETGPFRDLLDVPKSSDRVASEGSTSSKSNTDAHSDDRRDRGQEKVTSSLHDIHSESVSEENHTQRPTEINNALMMEERLNSLPLSQ